MSCTADISSSGSKRPSFDKVEERLLGSCGSECPGFFSQPVHSSLVFRKPSSQGHCPEERGSTEGHVSLSPSRSQPHNYPSSLWRLPGSSRLSSGDRWQAEEGAAKPRLSLSIQHNPLMANPIAPHAPLGTVRISSPQTPRLELRAGCCAPGREHPALDSGWGCGEPRLPVGALVPPPGGRGEADPPPGSSGLLRDPCSFALANPKPHLMDPGHPDAQEAGCAPCSKVGGLARPLSPHSTPKAWWAILHQDQETQSP